MSWKSHKCVRKMFRITSVRGLQSLSGAQMSKVRGEFGVAWSCETDSTIRFKVVQYTSPKGIHFACLKTMDSTEFFFCFVFM